MPPPRAWGPRGLNRREQLGLCGRWFVGFEFEVHGCSQCRWPVWSVKSDQEGRGAQPHGENDQRRAQRALLGREPAGIVRERFAEVVQHLLSANRGWSVGKGAIELVGERPEVGWAREVRADRQRGA